MSNQAKPAPPGPCNHSEGVSFTLAANFTLQSAESTSEFLPSTLADMTYKGLAQVGAGSWERAMSVAQSFVPRDRLPAPPYLGPSFCTGLPRSPTRYVSDCRSQRTPDAEIQLLSLHYFIPFPFVPLWWATNHASRIKLV